MRSVPIHPELERLGFRDYVAAVSRRGYDLVFPELVSASSATSLGDVFYDDWAPMLARQIPDAAELGLVFHSIRHYRNTQLIDCGVIREWRQDILGQGGSTEADECYRNELALERKRAALLQLPTVTDHLQPAPIRLRHAVIARMLRPTRPARRTRR